MHLETPDVLIQLGKRGVFNSEKTLNFPLIFLCLKNQMLLGLTYATLLLIKHS